jgi:hypothetical protein
MKKPSNNGSEYQTDLFWQSPEKNCCQQEKSCYDVF